MSNFVIKISRQPHPWPFRWGPWGRGWKIVMFEMDTSGQIVIFQRDRNGEDGLVDVPMTIGCRTGKSFCTTTVEWPNKTVQRRTRL